MLQAAANVSAAHAAGALLVNEEGRAALGEGEVRCALLVIERASDLHCKRVRDAGCVRIGQEREGFVKGREKGSFIHNAKHAKGT